jgi:DNA-binding NarL/FixJ family response regulator
MSIRVFIVDDHKLILDAWTRILSETEGIEVCGSAGESKKAYHEIIQSRPDIVLMDINLKEDSGIDLTKNITKTLPKTRVIGLSMHNDMAYVKQMLKNGASGYLTKNVEVQELILGIKTVHGGQNYVCNEIKDREFFQGLSGESNKGLTEKELEITQLIVSGQKSKDIADQLQVSKRTVDAHRYNIMKKLNLNNVAELVVWAKENGHS